MTDLDRLKKTFDEIGVKYTEEKREGFEVIDVSDTVHDFGYALFYFLDGKFHSLETFE